jgi:hypothetical protein
VAQQLHVRVLVRLDEPLRRLAVRLELLLPLVHLFFLFLLLLLLLLLCLLTTRRRRGGGRRQGVEQLLLPRGGRQHPHLLELLHVLLHAPRLLHR